MAKVAFVWFFSWDIASRSDMETAEISWFGRSRAVLLPEDYRFDTDEVRIRRHGNAVILEPIAGDWAWLDKVVGPVDTDFAHAVEENRIGGILLHWTSLSEISPGQ